jgi:integrase/recombinase XerD
LPKYQFKREPLTQDEATRLANACETPLEKLLVWTLLDTGLRVSELAHLKAGNIDWQARQLIVYGKGGPFGSRSKRRVVPMSGRIRPLIEAHFGLYDTVGVGVRTIQRLVKRVANKAKIARNVTPHVGRHTHAVTALQRGISLASLQRVLGHDHIETTAIYLNISGEEAAREYRDKW